MSNIEDYRKNIDNIDKEIVEKLEERMRVAENIAKFKQDNNLPVIDIIREREKLEEITEMASDDMASYARILYNTIMEMSKDHQRKITNRHPSGKVHQSRTGRNAESIPDKGHRCLPGSGRRVFSAGLRQTFQNAENHVHEEFQRRLCRHRSGALSVRNSAG